MSISARLRPQAELALKRYCRNRGISKTEAVERGLELLLRTEQGDKHSAWLAFDRIRPSLSPDSSDDRPSAEVKKLLDAKYPG